MRRDRTPSHAVRTLLVILLLFVFGTAGLSHGKQSLDFIYPSGTEIEPYTMYLEMFSNLESPGIIPRKVLGVSSALTYPLEYRGYRPFGKNNHYLMLLKSSMVGDIIEGAGPYFYNHPSPELKIIAKGPAQLDLLVTTNEAITTIEDLVGKRVGISPRTEIMYNENSEHRYFGTGHGIYNRIEWVRRGSMINAKMLLAGEIEAMVIRVLARVDRRPDNELMSSQLGWHPALELLKKSGKPVSQISYDPKIITTCFNGREDGFFPMLIAPEANPFSNQETWSLGRYWVLVGHRDIAGEDIVGIFRFLRNYQNQGKQEGLSVFNPEFLFPDDLGHGVWWHPGLEGVNN